jgi:DNA polymerase-3 subunit delta'
MAFNQILGQNHAISILRQAMAHGRLAHAYLFAGADGIGKRLTALTLAKAMNCLAPPEAGEACEQCSSCLKINSSNHADVLLIEPDGDFIKIDQVRELQRQLRFRPLEGGRRACILDSADRLNEAAANALLKTLEEPPAETHLFLITSRPHNLLPTILSRCQWIKFKPLSRDHLARILISASSFTEEQALFYASLSGGSASQALSLGDRLDYQKRVAWLEIFGNVFQKTPLEILEICEKIAKEEEDPQDLFELWKLWVRDLMVYKVDPEGKEGRFVNHDRLKEIVAQSQMFSFDQLQDLFRQLSEIQKFISMKVNRQLALETLMLEMKKGYRKPPAIETGMIR